MIRVCAWCRKEMGRKAGREGEITHGICPDCYRHFLIEDGTTPLTEFLERLGFPVFLVDGDVRLRAGNLMAAALVGKEAEALEGLYGGVAIECARSRLPGGCGKTIHCQACTIRNTVTDTYATGQSHHRVPARADRDTGDGPRSVRFLISTEKAGESVLLRIDEVEIGPAAGPPEEGEP